MNYEIDMTRKSNLGWRSNMTSKHNEIRENNGARSSKLLIKTMLRNVKNVLFAHDVSQAN